MMPLITRRSSTRFTPRVFVGRSGLIFANWASLSQNRIAFIVGSFRSLESQAPVYANDFMGPDPRERMSA